MVSTKKFGSSRFGEVGSDLYKGKYVFDNSPVPGAPGLAVFETRAARLRARWIAGRPIYHESCFREHCLKLDKGNHQFPRGSSR
jgi:hypothetical protein